MKIKLAVESMPRCGTHYVIRNLMQILHLGYCTIYPADPREGQIKREERFYGEEYEVTYDAAATWFIEDYEREHGTREDIPPFVLKKAKREYICKSHYNWTLPKRMKKKKIFLVGNVLDYAWLTTRMWRGQRDNPDFFLRENDPIYQIRVAQHLRKLSDWLHDAETINRERVIVYEALVYDEAREVRKLANIVGMQEDFFLSKWESAAEQQHRISARRNEGEGLIEEKLRKKLIGRFGDYLWQKF